MKKNIFNNVNVKDLLRNIKEIDQSTTTDALIILIGDLPTTDGITTTYTTTTLTAAVRAVEYFAYLTTLVWDKYIEILANTEYNYIINAEQ